MGDIDLIRKPDGSKKHPALTCKDLFKNYPTLNSGTYMFFLSVVKIVKQQIYVVLVQDYII